jgi:hypothetical protein
VIFNQDLERGSYSFRLLRQELDDRSRTDRRTERREREDDPFLLVGKT